MMTNIDCHSLQDMWPRLCRLYSERAFKVETRNGPAFMMDGGTGIIIRDPKQRVLMDPDRNCNHVFHLMESMWMLAGRQDTAFVSQFNSNIASYSDNGENFHAAYGHRWRTHFGVDQVESAIQMLSANPDDRRVVIGMWDPRVDGNGLTGKDFPCNVMIIPTIRVLKDGANHLRGQKVLDITIFNRSNDLVWGLCGANAVHMSFLHEYMATALGVGVGHWHHTTTNLHVYERHMDLVRRVAKRPPVSGGMPYCSHIDPSLPLDPLTKAQPVVVDAVRFLKEVNELCDGKQEGFEEPFLEETVEPAWASWREWKAGNKDDAVEIARCIESFDWRYGITDWYKRAIEKKG